MLRKWPESHITRFAGQHFADADARRAVWAEQEFETHSVGHGLLFTLGTRTPSAHDYWSVPEQRFQLITKNEPNAVDRFALVSQNVLAVGNG